MSKRKRKKKEDGSEDTHMMLIGAIASKKMSKYKRRTVAVVAGSLREKQILRKTLQIKLASVCKGKQQKVLQQM